MIRQIITHLLIVSGVVVLALSTSSTCMDLIWEKRHGSRWWSTYDYPNGDLCGMAHLDWVAKFRPTRSEPLARPTANAKSPTTLYLVGDSYTWSLTDTLFVGNTRFHFINRYAGGRYHLDSSSRNILIIELSECMIRDYFSNSHLLEEVNDSLKSMPKVVYAPSAIKPCNSFATFFPAVHVDDFFNRNINKNLQTNLFNYNIIMPMFATKAAFNYFVFQRASGYVAISDDGNFLFNTATISKTENCGSYKSVDKNEIDQLVANLNIVNQSYLQDGFNEVYLSIIPNTASIMQPKGYNNLIPLLQNDPELKMKIIDIYSVFKSSREVCFESGDGHWNNTGREKWLHLVNEILLD